MLGSFSGSHHEEDDEEEEEEEDQLGHTQGYTPLDHHRHHLHLHHHHQQQQYQLTSRPPAPAPAPAPPSLLPHPPGQMRQLLINCAELVAQGDFCGAHRLVSFLSTTSSPCGDSIDRLVHQFSKALSLRINSHYPNFLSTTTTTSTLASVDLSPRRATLWNINISPPTLASTSGGGGGGGVSSLSSVDRYLELTEESLQSSYLSLNQITPFIRFSHLTANQAILEAIQGHQSIHILDFDTMQGVQWPPLMQAIAERSDPLNPPMIRITGTGHNLETLQRTGNRLEKFAQTLGLRFQFNPILFHLNNDDPSSNYLSLQNLPSTVSILPDETLAVNCVLYLHKLLKDDDYSENSSISHGGGSRLVRLFLRTIKSMNPKVVTVAERESNNNHPIFLNRFVEALDHYNALFDSLEATLPPTSRERLLVEQVWFGREIIDIVSGEGDDRRERHEDFSSWVEKLTSSGFTNIPLSSFALSQAKLLLRLHYPSEGYQLQIINDSFFLGWQRKSLFTLSSWC